MPAAKTDRPTSTKSPTRSSVHVNCLRCAIFSSLPFDLSMDYRPFTRESASNIHLSYPQVLPGRPRNKLRHPAKPENESPPFWLRLPHFRWIRCAQPVWMRRRNESSPGRTHPEAAASREVPLRRKRRAAEE